MTADTANALVVAAAVAALVCIALSALIAAFALVRVSRDVRRVTRSLNDVTAALNAELPQTLGELRQTSANLNRVSQELSPRLARVDALLDEADATAASLRATIETAETSCAARRGHGSGEAWRGRGRRWTRARRRPTRAQRPGANEPPRVTAHYALSGEPSAEESARPKIGLPPAFERVDWTNSADRSTRGAPRRRMTRSAGGRRSAPPTISQPGVTFSAPCRADEKSFATPDERVDLPGIKADVVDMADPRSRAASSTRACTARRSASKASRSAWRTTPATR